MSAWLDESNLRPGRGFISEIDETDAVVSGEDALSYLAKQPADLLVLDMCMNA